MSDGVGDLLAFTLYSCALSLCRFVSHRRETFRLLTLLPVEGLSRTMIGPASEVPSQLQLVQVTETSPPSMNCSSTGAGVPDVKPGASVAAAAGVGGGEGEEVAIDGVGLDEGAVVAGSASAASSPQMKASADASGAEATWRVEELLYPGMTRSKLNK